MYNKIWTTTKHLIQFEKLKFYQPYYKNYFHKKIYRIYEIFTTKYPYLFHEVSCVPMRQRTPSRTSLMTSGGALNDRISDKVLALMLPTACFASSTNGLISSISSSMAFFRLDKKNH